MHTLFLKNTPILIVLLSLGVPYGHTFREDNARTGRAASSLSLPLKKLTTTTIKGPATSSPIVVNDTLYIGARDSTIYAFYNGTLIWSRKTRGWIDATPAYCAGTLYTGSRDGNLYILNSVTGDSLAVIVNNNTQCSSPLIYDSLVAFGRGGRNRQIDIYNLNTNRYVWFKSNSQPVYSSAAFSDSILCYGENSGNLVALDAHTGTPIWSYQTQGGVYLSSPAISGSITYFSPGGYDKNIYALSLTNGSLLWKNISSIESAATAVDRNIFRQFIVHSPKVRRKMLRGFRKYYRMDNAVLDQLAPLTRENTQIFVPLGGNATSSPAIGDSNVFVIHKEYGDPKPRFTITAFNKKTGAEQWYFSELRNYAKLGFCSSPLVVDTVVFFGWGEGKVYGFHTIKGTKVWEDSLDSDIFSSPTASNGRLYFATYNGSIVTYVPGGPEPVSFKKSTYCYPNPARGKVSHIQLYVTKSATVKVTIYNASEKPVLRFSKKLNAEEKYIYDWNIKDVANGVYFALVKVTYDDGGDDKKVLKIAVLR